MLIKFDQQEISFIVGEFLRSKFNTEVAVTDVSASGTRSASGLCLEANVHLGEITYEEISPEAEKVSVSEPKKPTSVKSSDFTNGIDLKVSTELAQMEFDNPQMDNKELLDKMIEFAGEAAVYQKYSRHPRFSQLLNQPAEEAIPEPVGIEAPELVQEEIPPFDVDTSAKATEQDSPESEQKYQTVEKWLANNGSNSN